MWYRMASHGMNINQPFCLTDQTLVLQCRYNVLLRSKNGQTQESFQNREAIKTTKQPLLLNYKKKLLLKYHLRPLKISMTETLVPEHTKITHDESFVCQS